MKIEIPSFLMNELYLMYQQKYHRVKQSACNRINNISSKSVRAKDIELKRVEENYLRLHKSMVEAGLVMKGPSNRNMRARYVEIE